MEMTEDTENQLLTYLQNILKCQIQPMDFMDLRDLIKEAPKKLKLFKFVEESYPDEQFLGFLQKYPNIFLLNPNRTVVLAQGNNFTIAFAKPNANENVTSNRDYDEVDGRDNGEYISGSESDSEDEDTSDDQENCSSSIPDSSLHNSLTSDSDTSSLSSKNAQ